MDFIGILKEQFTRREMVNDCNLAIFLLWECSLIKELKHKKGCPSTLMILLLDSAGLVADKTTGYPESLDLCGHWDMVQRWEVIQLSPLFASSAMEQQTQRLESLRWKDCHIQQFYLVHHMIHAALRNHCLVHKLWQWSWPDVPSEWLFPLPIPQTGGFLCFFYLCWGSKHQLFSILWAGPCGEVSIDFHEQGIWWQYRSSSLMTCSVQDQQKTKSYHCLALVTTIRTGKLANSFQFHSSTYSSKSLASQKHYWVLMQEKWEVQASGSCSLSYCTHPLEHKWMHSPPFTGSFHPCPFSLLQLSTHSSQLFPASCLSTTSLFSPFERRSTVLLIYQWHITLYVYFFLKKTPIQKPRMKWPYGLQITHTNQLEQEHCLKLI